MATVQGNFVYYEGHSHHLISSLHQQYSCNQFVDLCIDVQGSEIFAHKAVMAAASPLFRDRINEFGECQARINLEHSHNGDVNVEDIKLLVEYIYKGEVSIPETRLPAFLELGIRYQVLGLCEQSSNLGSQLSLLSSPISNYTIPQHLPSASFGTLQCQESLSYEDPQNIQNDLGSHNFHSLFSNNSFMSPEKLSDSAIKQDKSISVPTLNSTFSDLCSGNPPDESFQLIGDRNFHLNVEANPKLCNIQHFTNDTSVRDSSEFPSVTNTSNPFPSGFLAGSLQIQSEHSKDMFEDRAPLSSSGASDPDGLFSNLSSQPNPFFNAENLGTTNTTGHHFLGDIPFQSCHYKTPSSSTMPEGQRLKVKASIGGVSLQDTSQTEKNCSKGIVPIEEIHVNESNLSHSTEDRLETETPRAQSVEPIETEVEDFICSHCQKCLSSLDDLTLHLYEEHNTGTLHKCLICSFKTPVENCLVDHGKKHLGSSDRRCYICNKRFKTRSTLRNHLACHASDKWFRCNVCSAHYSQRNNLVKHLASKHRLDMDGAPIKDPFNCQICPFSTWAPYKLKNHMDRCHTKDKPFKCSECSYSTTERTSLVKHFRTHTQEKPYICDSCGKCFVTVSSLKRHYRVHTKEKPFKCTECSKPYADKKRLNDHYLKHKSIKPFRCNECEYSCRRKDNLQSHMRRNHKPSNLKEV